MQYDFTQIAPSIVRPTFPRKDTPTRMNDVPDDVSHYVLKPKQVWPSAAKVFSRAKALGKGASSNVISPKTPEVLCSRPTASKSSGTACSDHLRYSSSRCCGPEAWSQTWGRGRRFDGVQGGGGEQPNRDLTTYGS